MNFDDFINNTWVNKGIKIAITIAVSMILYYVVTGILNKTTKHSKVKNMLDKKGNYFNLIKTIIRYVFMLIVLLIILQILEIDITSIVAGVGLFGAAFVLAIQDFFKDITRGSSIISGEYYKVGDIVKYKDVEGKVIYLGLKNTKIQVLSTGNIRSIANRNIEDIEVVSNFIFINIPLPYELKVNDAEKIIKDIVSNVKKLKNIEESEYIGTNELNDSSISYLLKVKCNPINKLQARRDTIRQILLTLEENNVSVPYNQIDVHQK